MDVIKLSGQSSDTSSLISVIGEIDISNAADFKRQLRSASTIGSEDIFIDFSQLTYIDSQGLNVLAYLYNELRKEHRRIVISNASQTVRRLLHITGFDRIMLVED